MTLALRLVLAFAAVSTCVFGAVGFVAVRIVGDTVEGGLERRIDSTLSIVRARQDFFLFEAARRQAELRQVADISGFEIVVVKPGGDELAASSLPENAAREFLDLAPDGARFVTDVAGVGYRGARADIAGRTIYLLSPSAPIATAKKEATRPVVVVSALGLLLTVVLGAVLARTVTRPVRRLAASVSEMPEDRLTAEIPPGGGREVESLAGAFREMLARLERYREELVRREKMATLGQFSAAVAHELRNPLSSLRMTLEMLRAEAPTGMREDLDMLMSEMARLDHSVEELLFYAGTPRYTMAAVDVVSVVEGTLRTLRPLAEHLGVAIETDGPATAPVRADEGKLRQAVTNLVLNAVQAAGDGGEVGVNVAEGPEAVTVTVTDTGPGIPEEIEARLFEPFVSGREGGTGLGLAVTRAIAEAHGGRVELVRRDGRTESRLDLPR